MLIGKFIKTVVLVMLTGLLFTLEACSEEAIEEFIAEVEEEESLDEDREEIQNGEEAARGEESEEEKEAKEEEADRDSKEKEEETDRDSEKADEVQEGEAKDGSEKETVKVTIPESELSGKTLKFKTVTLDNKEVSQDIFSDYDITVVHVWGTFCGGCLQEMKDYADFYKNLPANINLVGIVCDVYDGIDSNAQDAKEILGDAGAEFMNLVTSDDIYEITYSFQYVPSTFFVDKEGHVIGEMMDGAGFEDTKRVLDGYTE